MDFELVLSCGLDVVCTLANCLSPYLSVSMLSNAS